MTITPNALASIAARAVELTATMRAGEAAWNALCENNEPVALRIQGTASDPYKDDTRLPAFWQALTEAAIEMDEPNDEEVA